MFHVVIGCAHEITLSKTQTLPDGRVKQCDGEGVSEIEYQLVTLPRFTSLLYGYDTVIIGHRHIVVPARSAATVSSDCIQHIADSNRRRM